MIAFDDMRTVSLFVDGERNKNGDYVISPAMTSAELARACATDRQNINGRKKLGWRVEPVMKDGHAVYLFRSPNKPWMEYIHPQGAIK